MGKTIGGTSSRQIVLIIGVVLVACNLRAAITSVGPLISFIREDMILSNGAAGMLTTLPLLGFAILSPLAPKIGQKLGNEMTVFVGLIVLLLGLTLRSAGLSSTLFFGTALIGIGIAIGNVILPSIVKHYFPTRVGLMTSLYSTAMGAFAAIASGVSVPLAYGVSLGWRGSLVFWASLAIVALIIWIPQLRTATGKASRGQTAVSMKHSIWTSRLAWQVTLFMGFQSFLFYCAIAWLPEILLSKGMGVQAGGWMLAIMQLASLPATFMTPILADRFSDQRGIVITIAVIYLTGILGLFFNGYLPFTITSVLLLGVGQGACISLSLALFGLRTTDAQQARALSGMAQSVGYFMAAIGPTLIGVLFDSTHAWTLPLVTMIIVAVFMTVTGLKAGKDEYVDDGLTRQKV